MIDLYPKIIDEGEGKEVQYTHYRPFNLYRVNDGYGTMQASAPTTKEGLSCRIPMVNDGRERRW